MSNYVDKRMKLIGFAFLSVVVLLVMCFAFDDTNHLIEVLGDIESFQKTLKLLFAASMIALLAFAIPELTKIIRNGHLKGLMFFSFIIAMVLCVEVAVPGTIDKIYNEDNKWILYAGMITVAIAALILKLLYSKKLRKKEKETDDGPAT